MMKPMPACVTVLALTAFLSATLSGQEPEAPKARQQAPQTRAELIRLEYAVADETVPILFETLPVAYRATTKIVSDTRTNSLVVSGEEGAQAEIKRLVGLLDVAVKGKSAATPRRAVSYEVVLFMLGPGADDALKLPKTSTGVLDSNDAEGILAKIRDGLGKPGVTEVAKLSLMADETRPWKSRQSAQVPYTSGPRGGTQMVGYQEAMLDFSVQPETGRGGERRLAVSCKIERFTELPEKDGVPDGSPPAKQSTTIEFNTPAQDGKLVMASVQSSAPKFESSYILFIRAKA